MFKRLDHLLVIVAIAATAGVILASQFFNIPLSLPNRSAAKIPASVGDKPAPIPVLDVEQIVMNGEKTISLGQARSAIISSLASRSVSPKYSLKEYQLSWAVSVEDGTLVPVKAQVFVPVTDNGQQFPVIVYGAGTTGLDDRCAPSRENLSRGNMGNYRNYMIAEASQGYIVVMPNYEGFDNPDRSQHYFNKDNEARTMLSAAKATLQSTSQVALPIKPNALFLGGYSQGGHAAFSAADYASTYAPDLTITGVFGHGPTTEITEFLKNNPNLAAYFVASFSDYYPAINPETILEPEWIGYLDRARTICVDEGFGINSTTIPRVYKDPFEVALKTDTLGVAFPEINAIFVENSAGTSYTNIPSMVVQGGGDPIVTTAAQDVFIDQLCQRGVNVDYKQYPGVHHFSTRQVSFADTNAWIDALSNGQTVTNSCVSR